MEQTDAQDHSSLYVPTELMVATNLELSSYWTLTTDTRTRSQATGLETSTGVGPISFCLPWWVKLDHCQRPGSLP